jgi:hypothetical protein
MSLHVISVISGGMIPEEGTDRLFWTLKMGSAGCPETSVRNYHSLSKNLEESSSHLRRGESLKLRIIRVTYKNTNSSNKLKMRN